jgi:hypothetical protein
MEFFTSIAAVTALLISKLVNDQHADNKTVDELERKLENPEPRQKETKH